jgi:hypothetical protein
MRDYRRSLLVIGFIEHLQKVTTNNFDGLTEIHTTKNHCNYSTRTVFSVCCIFSSRYVVTDLNNVLCIRTHILAEWRLARSYTLLF